MTVGPAFQSWSNYPIMGPYAIGLTALTTASSEVLEEDDARTGVIFHNPGTKNKRIMPDGSTLTGGSGGILIYPQNEFTLIKQPNSRFNINAAWNAVTDDNSDGVLTVLNFTPLTPGAKIVAQTVRLLQQIPVDSPIGTQVTNIGMGSVPVLAADANRQGVVFTNSGPNIIAVCPDNLAAAIGAGSVIILPGASKEIIGNDLVRVNTGWNAIAAAGANNILTILSLYG